MTYDFSGLSDREGELLTFQGWTAQSTMPAVPPGRKAMRRLIARGLVIERSREYRGLTVTEYEVPLDVHVAWCARCSEAEEA